ncbi:sec1 family domain-containing protein 1-like [Clavelina lepadiformis]|uniref:sec1 family domain-containing protein 1-like n=1 Tax=Clavelina lepadiformis TaxID=159417 RepID=UPI004041278F
MSFSIRDKQTYALKSMFNLGRGPIRKHLAEPEWKVVIYDQFGQDIISPLLSVADLRELGVTLYLPLHSVRDAIPDVAALYFVIPTEESIRRICQDMHDQLYDNYYFNFISGIPRSKLEDLASAALHANAESQVAKVYDQYVNFVTLEKHLFILKNKVDETSYFSLNKANLKDYEMSSITDSIVESLYSVFVTIGSIPIIRCPTGNAAEVVAEKLDKKLRENLRDTRNSFFTSIPNAMSEGGQPMSSFQRPLLLIVDRSLDLATPLHHTWTYQAMIHDVLDLHLNTVTIQEAPKEGNPARKSHKYNLSQTDKFWQMHMGNPFPEVAEAVQEEIEEYKTHEEEVQRLKAAMGLAGEDGPVDISDNTAKLTSAMSSLPELLEKKRLIDMHTTIATSVLSSIKERKLDEYFEMEEKLMSKTTTDKSVLDFINDPEGGEAEDKMRLFIIYYISQPSNSDINIDQFEQALEAAGCDMAPLKYIKRWRQYVMPSTNTQQQLRGGGTKTIGMFSHLMSTGSQFVMEGVKNLVVKKHNLPITKILDSLMELKSSSDVENYRYFDPKLTRAVDPGVGRSKMPYNDAIVFVVGGGNYIEYHNLMDYVKNKPGKRVSYGCCELLNATEFLQELSLLGKEM